MNFPDILNHQADYLNQIIETNKRAEKFGLVLTLEEAGEIIKEREHALSSLGRVDLELTVTTKLIDKLCSSPYVNRYNYVDTITELQEVFYYAKNETEEQIADQELLEILINFFQGPCAGSLELLRGRELDSLIRSVRSHN